MGRHAGKVSDAVTKRLQDIAKKFGGGSVVVGFLEGATYSDGTPVASVAYWNEFGHGGIFPAPARPFFRTMIAKQSPGWAAKMAKLARMTGNNGALVLKLMGEDIEGALKQSIIDTNEPGLSGTTLALRAKFGNSPEKITFADVVAAHRAALSGKGKFATGTQAKPLVWTGHMLDSTGYEVKK